MIIKDFSPIDTGTTLYFLNDPDFKGTELFFSDSNEYLYAMVLRSDPAYYLNYDVIKYFRMDGYWNGTDYDYRIDYENYIRIVHSDIYLNTTGDTYYSDIQIANSVHYLLIDSNDFMQNTGFTQYINTKTNGDQFIYTTGITGSIAEVDFNYYCIFTDFEKYGYPIDYYQKAYKNSNFLIFMAGTSLDYFKIYDINNNLIKNYATYVPAISSGYYRIAYFYIPKNAYKIEFRYNYYTTNTVTKYVENECISNNYLFHGTDYAIDSINFTGKRNKVENTILQTINYGKRTKNVNIYLQSKYIQNTGFNITETEYFNIAKAPYIFEISGGTITEWMIDENTFEGNNTKTFEGRNIQLNLTKLKQTERYTGFSNGFYT